MFCGFCGNENEKQNQIVIRDPFSSDIGFKVNRENTNQMLSIMSEVVQYHVVKPSMYQQQLKKCRQKNMAFTDRQFPPSNEKSLNYGVANRKIVWKRIRQIIPNAVMVDGRMDSTCVQQGNLGDCYFLACISSIAEVPERIQKIFCNQMQLKKEGIYRLQVACQGQYKQIIIDDYIPVFGDTNRPVFSKPHDNEVWVMLIQKAWAKLSGSYGSIEAGYPHEVFQTFLVSPSYYYEIPNIMVKQPFEKLILWNNLKEASTHKRPICAGSRQAYTCKGIKAAHTYSILGVFEVPTNNQTVNLLKLRNPWGDVEYAGKYSQHDDGFWATVNPMNRLAIFRKQNEEDGIFTMEFNQFLRNFQCVDISHECQDYSYNYQKVQAKSREPIFFELQIQRTQIQDFYLTMQKQFDRNSYIKHRQVEYGYSRLLIAKKNILQVEDKQIVTYQYTNSRLQTNFPDVTIRGSSLNPGKYVVMAQTEFPNLRDGYLTISLYSKSIMNIKRIGYPDPLFLHKVFTNYAHQFAKIQNRVRLNNQNNDWSISEFLFGEGGIGYVCVCLEPSSKERVLITCNIKKIFQSGFFLLERNAKQGILQIIVNPNQQSLILFGVDFTKNLRQVTFPPKGIKISRII